MCLHPINNKNKFLAILFFSFSFHSDVLQNTEENICCYFYFIATLIVNPYDLYLNLLSNILFVSTIYIQEFKGYIIWLLNGLKPCYQIITSLANTKLWKEFCVLMSHGHDPILTFSRHVPVFLPKRQNLNKCHTLFEIPKNKIKNVCITDLQEPTKQRFNKSGEEQLVWVWTDSPVTSLDKTGNYNSCESLSSSPRACY